MTTAKVETPTEISALTIATRNTDAFWSTRLLLFAIAVTIATAIAAICLRHSEDSVFEAIKATAMWLKGGPKPEVVTWPAWGYSWLIVLVPSVGILIAIQASVGVLALTALARRLWIELPKNQTLLTGLLLFAVPWHNIQVAFYPSALAGSFTLLAILCLDRALAMNAIRYALLAGALAGLAQNFRTEFVLLPLFLGICVVCLKLAGIMHFPSLKPIFLFIVTAFACQVPWAMFYHTQTGKISLTESNFGHVVFVSLGSDPRNPWGLKAEDQSAYSAVRNAGHNYSSLSDKGSQFLLNATLQKVKEHPDALVPRTLRQLRNTLMAPFNWGEPKLNEQGRLDLDVLREELKSRLGAGVNVSQLQDYRDRGLVNGATQNMTAWLALVYQSCATGLGSIVLLLGAAGILLLLCCPTLRPSSPLLYLLGSAVCYKTIQDVLLYYQVNYLSNVYPMLLPFVTISISTISLALRSIVPFSQNRANLES